MIAQIKQGLRIAVLLSLSPTVVSAQTNVDFLWDLYEQSVLYPEDFDFHLLELMTAEDNPFDESLRAHMDNVMARLAAQSERHRDFCNQYADSNMRWDCLKNDVAASVFVWCVCLYGAVFQEYIWSDTICGQNQILAKRVLEQMGVDAVALLRETLPAIEPAFRQAVR